MCYHVVMEIKIKGIYQHFKGDYYLVEDIAYHSETCEKMVVYRALYGENKLWVRPYAMFVEEVVGKSQPHRFELREIKSVKLTGEKSELFQNAKFTR